MPHPILPIPCKPWTLYGLSERLILSHYENNYGGAVRTLNAIRAQLAALDLASAPAHQIRALKREELVAQGSVTLHELYFRNLGGDGRVPEAMGDALSRRFGSVDAWHREFVATAHALAGGSDWVVLGLAPQAGAFHIQIAFDHTQSLAGVVPLLVLDMYEHAYALEFGANAVAYIDAFMRNVDWGSSGGASRPRAGAERPRPPRSRRRPRRSRSRISRPFSHGRSPCRSSTPAPATTSPKRPT